MTCDQSRELLALFASDALDGDEKAGVLRHLNGGCPECAAELAALRAILVGVALSAPAAEAPAGVRDRVLAAIADPAPAPVPMTPLASAAARRALPKRFEWRARFLPAAIAAVLAAIAVYVPLQIEATRLESAVAASAARAAQVARDLSMLEAIQRESQARLDETRQALRSRDLLVVALAPPAPDTRAGGRLLWDRQGGVAHLVATGLPALPAGRQYELWLIPAGGAPIAAGVFDPEPNGDATHAVEVPAGIGSIAMAAITDEPAGGVPAPTGSMHLIGTVSS